MMNTNCTHAPECKCISWRPIVVGALVAVGLSFLLNLFSVAIGLTAFNTNSDGVQNLMFGGLIATAIGIVASMFASGWLAGYLGARYCAKRHLGAMYGFLTWCVALLLMVFLASHLQEYVQTYTHFISGTAAEHLTPANVANQVANQTPDNVVISSYIVFALFFLSAFSCSLGGHCGMQYICKEECSR